ncbi:hypothetical protein Zmor_017869 [Zophobas morio]|uniref:C2H2-type domain-containing protein n=1 Tax=Zophobas morio TaxID=2755281 RepID=A0AA38MD08_9CUCU|nr:hypothetical protein Zmor_017869 [Zophobas morio]
MAAKEVKFCEELESESESKMFGPLNFDEVGTHSPQVTYSEVVCLLCDNIFNIPLSFEIFVRHLFEVHNLLIEDVQTMDNLPEYIRYWRDKFKQTPIEEIVPAIRIDSSHRLFFMLSTLLEDDKKLRHRLKLEHVLKVQEFERTDTSYTRMCLFCKLDFEGKRVDFIAHLENHHNMQLGNPQNLVYIEELVEKIAETVDKLICMFCNRLFPERMVLKEHMRKKLHKRINRRNSDYDKFFIVNYLESDKKAKNVNREKDEVYTSEDSLNDDEEYYDWNEKEDVIICLFCDKRETDINILCLHMEADHGFDFAECMKEFDFYQKVKFVNYVRRQMHRKRCLYCDVAFTAVRSLQNHLIEEEHCKIPDIKVFDQPEFYFPTYENDAFLYLIDDVED